ncbi:MAG: RagB/SusD family nutrient uptake outer membrane protein [Draconibacterium sp.]|nr:RagB/SusD family nutrient uptake outer membrane protein [Draconibacterium sp.]
MKSKLIILAVLTGLLLGACESDFVYIDNPSETNYDAAVNNPDNINLIVNEVYDSYTNVQFIYTRWANYLMVQEARSDNAYILPSGNNFKDMGTISRFLNTSTHFLTDQHWRLIYEVVRTANQALEKLVELKAIESNPEYDRMMGEVYYLRGLIYLTAIRDFGEAIPIKTENGTSIEEFNVPPAGPGEAWAQVIADLKEAQKLLPKKEEYSSKEAGRATQGAATGMLGKAYLYMLDYANAVTEFEKIINGQVGNYSLIQNFRDNFTEDAENNSESLYEIQNANSINVATSVLWNGLSRSGGVGVWRNIAPTESLLNTFKEDPADPRWHMTFYAPDGAYHLVNGKKRSYKTQGTVTFRKYMLDKRVAPGWKEGTNVRLLRFADILLMAAEAHIEIGNEAKAKEYISLVRQRANNIVNDQEQLFFSANYTGEMPEGFPIETDVDAYMATHGLSLKEMLMRERRVELAYEQLRYYDLIRWQKAGWINISDYITEPAFVFGKNEIFPIPQVELAANTAMVPNSAN